MNKSTLSSSTSNLAACLGSSTWCYGLAKLVNPNRIFFKLMWCSFILASVMFCIYGIYTNIQDYVIYDVIIKEKTIYDHHLDFPQIIICSDDKLNVSVIEYCQFERDYCQNDLETVNIFDSQGSMFACLKFNKHENITYKQNTILGDKSGFKLKLGFSGVTIFNVYITDKREIPIRDNFDFYLTGGSSTTVRLRKSVKERLPEPYNRCTKSFSSLKETNQFINRTIELNGKYQYDKCFLLCYFQNLSEKLNCSYPGLFKRTSVTNCSEIPEDKLSHFKFEDKCHEKDMCPKECDSVSYEYKVNTLSDLSANTSYLNMKYETLEYTYSREIPSSTIIGLISKLGGLLGLCIGFKLLSFVEILEFFLELALKAKEKIKSRKIIH